MEDDSLMRSGLRAALATIAMSAALSACSATLSGEDAQQQTASTTGAASSTSAWRNATPQESLQPGAMELFHRRAAEIAIEERKIFGAVAHLAKVRETAPNDLDIAYDLARHLRYVGALAEADSVINEALRRDSGSKRLRGELAKIRIAQGRSGEAVGILTKMAEEQPGSQKAWASLGVAHDRAGDHASAQKAYDKALSLAEPNAALLNNAGLSRLLAGDADGAVSMLRRASAGRGASAQVSQNLAMAMVFAGDRTGAKNLLEDVLPDEQAAKALAFYEQAAANPTQLRDVWGAAAGG